MFDPRLCLNTNHPDVKKWIDNVGKENMYKVFVQNNYLLPDYESYIGAEEVFSKDIQDYKNFLDKLLPSNQYEFDVLDRLKSNGFNILGTAAFYKKTFYFKDKVTKNELAEEAFHSIVQTLMDEQERTQMYNGGRELLTQRLKKEKRSFKEYISELEKLFPNVSRETLEQFAYEEEIAKDFVNYYNSEGKTNRYSQERINTLSKRLSLLGNNALPIAELLHRLYERIKSLFNLTSDKKEVEMLFKKIANGGYKNTKIVNNNDNVIPSFAIYKNNKNKIIPSDEIAQMKRSIAVLAKNLYENEGLELGSEKSISQAIEIYNEFLQNQIDKADEDKILLLNDLVSLLYQEDEEFVQEITDQFESNKTIFDEVYDEEEESKDDDLGSNRNFDDSANQQSPESRSKELKILMNTTGTIKGKVFVDTTGKTVAYQDLESLIITDPNGQVFNGDLSIYKKIDILEIADEKMIYSAIVRNLSNISDEKKRLLKLIELSMYNEDVQIIKGKQDNQNTKTFINALLKDILGTSDDFENLKETTKNNLNSTKSLSDIININSKPLHVQRFLLALRGFNLASRNIFRVEIDIEKGWGKVADIEASNKKSIQKNYWDSNYRTNQNLSYDKFKKEFSDNYIKFNEEVVNEERTNIELARIYNKILEQLGVDVNGEYLIDFINKIAAKEYPILYNNRVFVLNDLNIKLKDLNLEIQKRTEYPNIYKGDDKDIEIGAEKDPLDDIDFNSFLNFIAEGNIEFDERVVEASHKDGYGNSVYSHQLPTLTLKFGNSFKSIDEFNKMKQGSIIGVGVNGEVITSNAINSFKDENPLIDDLTVDGEISALRLKQVKILTFDTTQLKSYKSKTTKGFLIENDSEYSDNKVIGLDQMNDSEYALTNMILYTEHAKQTGTEKDKIFYNAPVSLGHNEASKQTDYLTIFHDKDAITLDGQLGEQAKQKIAKLIKTEYDKIKENSNNLKDQIAKLGKPTNVNGVITRNELYNIKEPNVYEGYSTGSYTAVLDESGNLLYYKADKGFKGLQFSPEVSPFINEKLLAEALSGNEFNEKIIVFDTVLDFLQAEYKIIDSYGLLDKLPHALRDSYLVYNPATGKVDKVIKTEGKNTNGVEIFNKELSQENKVKSFLLNYWLGSTMANRMRYGSHNFNFKLTSTDSYKRYRMFNGATLSAKTSIKNEQLGINDEINYITYATIAEPKGISDIDRNSKPIDRADAAMRSTSQGIRKILHGMSKLNRKISEVLDKLDQGVKLTPKEWEEMVATSSLITAMKPLAASGEQTIKTGLTPTLTLSMTSYDTIITADKNKKFKNEKDTFSFGNNKITVDKYGRTTQSVGNTEEIIWDNFNKVFKLWKAKPGDKDLILYSQRMFLRGYRKEDGVWTYKGKQYEIDTLVPPTALKTAQRNILPYVSRSVNRTDKEKPYIIEDTNFDFPKEYNETYTFANAIDADFFGEQVQNPQGKIKITTPTQNIEILTNEQNNNITIRIIENGILTEKIIELKDLQPYYQKLLAKRNNNGKNLAVAELFKKEPLDRDVIKAIYEKYEKNKDNLTRDEIRLLTEVVNDFGNKFGIYGVSDKNFKKKFNEVYKENGFRKEVPNYTYFFERLIEGLKLTGGSGQDYEFLQTNEDGTPIYNVNIPLNKDKMIQYVLKHFSSGVLSHKVAGNAYVLASDYGMKSLKKLRLVKDEKGEIDYTWDVIHNKTEGYNEKLVELAEKGLEDLSDKIYDHRAWQIGNKEASELHTWFEEQREKLERGEEVYFIDGLRYMKKSYTESGEFNTWVSEAMMPKLNGKQTSIMDSIRFALGVRIPSQDKQSSINIEWVDFLDDTIGNTIVVPKEIVQISGSDFDIDKLYATQYEGYWENGEYIKYKDTFEDYKKYLFKTSKPLKKALKDRLAENDTYQDSLARKKDLKNQKKSLFDKINSNTENTLKETGLDKKEFKSELNRFFEQLDEINNSEESEKDKRDYKQYLFLQYRDLLSINKDISQSFKEIGGIEEELDLVNKIIGEETLREEPFVLKQFDLISSEEDFEEGFNNAVINNEILDTQRAMLTSDSVLFGDVNNPARGTGDVPMDLSLLENLQKNSTVTYSKNQENSKSLEEIKKIYGENIKFDEDDNQYIVYPFIKIVDKKPVELLQVFKNSSIPHNSLTVQSNYQQGTIIARRGIGVTVNGLLQAIVANKIGLQLRVDKFNLTYNGDPVEFTYKDHNGNRVFAIKNTLVSAATDEAKEEQLKKHGIKGDDLNVIDLLTNFGFSIDESIAIVNSKIVKKYKDYVSKNNLELKEDRNKVKTDEDSKFEELIQDLKGDENEGVDLTSQKIFEGLYTENEEILGAYLKIAEMSRELSDLSKLIKGKKGYTKGKLSELTDIQNIAVRVGLIETMKEYEPTGYFDWTTLKYSDKIEDIKSFVEITQELTYSKLNQMFFEYEFIAIDLKNTVLGETNEPDSLDLSDKIEKDVNTFMIVQMIKEQKDEKYKYLQDFLNIDKINPSNNVDNFVNEFFKNKQISKEGNAYKLLKHIIGVKGKVNSTKNSESVDTLRLAAVSKLNPAQQDNIRNLFLEMYYSDNDDLKIREDEKTFAKNLFAYFVLKDGLQFRQYNISKIFPTEMFLEISEVLNDFKNTLGYLNNEEIEALNSKFKELWYSDIKNKKYKQKIKPGKAVISYKFENKEKVEQKEFKFGDPPLYLEIPINARIKDLKKSNIEYESSPDGVVIKLPQYFDYNGYSFKRIKTDNESVYTYIRQPYYGSTIIDMVVDAGVIPAASEVIGKNGSKLQNLIDQLEQEGTRTGYIQFYKNLLSNRYSPNFDKTLGVSSMNQRVQSNKPKIISSEESLQNVNNVSELTNHSGGAYGGDTFWDLIGRTFGVTNHKHYRDADNANLSQQLKTKGVKAEILTKEQMDFARKKLKEILGVEYKDDLKGNLQVRNFYQVYNADAIYAIAKIKTDDEVYGGTNTAVKLGIRLNKPVYIWDITTEQWYEWEISTLEKDGNEYQMFVPTRTPILTKNFAGIGSRDIENYNVQKDGKWQPREEYVGKEKEEKAKQAIRDVYQATKDYLENKNTNQAQLASVVDTSNVQETQNKVIVNISTNKYELFPDVYANGDQEKALDLMFDFVSPKNKQKEFLLIGKGGTGKAQPLYSKIYTPDGYKLMRDIKVGDEVLNEQGKSTTVLGVYPQGIKPVYRVYFNDGFYVDSCSEHNWFVKSLKTRKREIQLKIKNKKLENKYEVVTTSEILNSIKVCGKNKSELNYKMPINDSVFFNKKDLNIHPYLLGALIGDGGLTESIRFTNIDSYILKKISAIIENTNPELDLKQVSNTISYGITKKIRNSKIENKIWEEIKKLGLNTKSENKFIPKDYLYTSKEDRIELLQGLMDTDGTVDKRGTHVMYNTCSKKLADDVAELVQSLGCIARITHKLNNKKGCYNITINQTNNFNLFSLPRKQEKVINKTKYKVSRYISDVKYIGDFEQQCIMVSSPSHLYLTDNFTVTHNTTIVKKVVENLIKQGISTDRIFGVAPTHVAKKVLNRSFNGLIAKDNVVTLASALGIKLDETTGEFEKDYNLKGITSESDYIILDESSMVSDSLFNLLKSMVKSGTKIIFMGDKGQLPPVGQETDSKVFDINNTFELLEKMRQAATSPIINITEAVYKAQKEGNKNSNPITDDLRVDKFDDVSGSSVSFLQNEKEFLQNYVNDLKLENDFFNTKIVTFNNERNNSAQSVKTLNNKVRNILFGSESQKIQFFPDEIITSYGKWREEVNNGDNFVIKKINEFKNQSHAISVFSKAKGQREINIVFDEIDLLTINDEGDTIKITVLANSSKEKYDKLVSDLWKKDKQLAFAVSNYYANIQYGYAITSHKSQGSTYKNVYVAEDNILGGSNLGSIKSKLQSLYVATSRASKKLVMLSNKNNREKLTNFEEEYFIENENVRYQGGKDERDTTSINDLFAEASGCDNF